MILDSNYGPTSIVVEECNPVRKLKTNSIVGLVKWVAVHLPQVS